jgi:hypothetical protein
MKRLLLLSAALAAVLALHPAAPAAAASAERVSVQPIDGELGPAVRRDIARMLRAHGFRPITSIARVDGTGQYLTLARDHRLAALVTADIEEHRTRHTIRFLVWNGASGAVLGRWEASAAPKRLPKAVAKGFWKHLKQAFDEAAAPPPATELEPAPPMFVNAGDPID